jgi:Domain of unknown function (DUF4282)
MAGSDAATGVSMTKLADLFQWERFITPSIIKVFFWLVVIIMVLLGLSSAVSALALMIVSPGRGILMLLAAVAGVAIGVIFARIATEFILIVFRINEHLGAIRSRADV